eukprot:scaffold2249_cov86-Cylindrotheca_fusiformis.AAC.8
MNISSTKSNTITDRNNADEVMVDVVPTPSHTPWYRNPHQVTAMLSNFSTAYNDANVSLALPILESLHKASEGEISACGSTLLAGMIVGQVFGGALGKETWLGRTGALRLVIAIQVIASVGSSCMDSTKHNFYESLAIWRFVLGIGAGGVYPLAAALSAERGGGKDHELDSSSNNNLESDASVQMHRNQIHRVVLTFSTQGLGFIAVPIVTVVLFKITGDLNVIWRLLLAFGCIPGLVIMLIQCRVYSTERSLGQLTLKEDEESNKDDAQVATKTEQEDVPEPNQLVLLEEAREYNNDDAEGVVAEPKDLPEPDTHPDKPTVETESVARTNSSGWFHSFVHEPGLGRKVIGTAGTWFLFDIVFYGNTIFQAIVVEAAFGQSEKDASNEELFLTARRSLILTGIALPGYFVAALLMGKRTLCITQTPQYVMMQGFAAMAVLYAVIGISWNALKDYPAVLLVLYGLTFFFANYGPNTTTFILPSLLYSREHRTTWNGISAACGKIGAITGTSLFEPVSADIGDDNMMLVCAGLSAVAFVLSSFVPKVQAKQP